ncbi:hypothetical protein M3J09_009280 [Ascochyta lentis]
MPLLPCIPIYRFISTTPHSFSEATFTAFPKILLRLLLTCKCICIHRAIPWRFAKGRPVCFPDPVRLRSTVLANRKTCFLILVLSHGWIAWVLYCTVLHCAVDLRGEVNGHMRVGLDWGGEVGWGKAIFCFFFEGARVE